MIWSSSQLVSLGSCMLLILSVVLNMCYAVTIVQITAISQIMFIILLYTKNYD